LAFLSFAESIANFRKAAYGNRCDNCTGFGWRCGLMQVKKQPVGFGYQKSLMYRSEEPP
jgi:hypothetical protein